MPAPTSRYQEPLAFLTSIPAASQRLNSSLCVPLSSPRDTNGAAVAAIWASAATTSFMPLNSRRVGLRSYKHKIVVHHIMAFYPEALRHKLLFGG